MDPVRSGSGFLPKAPVPDGSKTGVVDKAETAGVADTPLSLHSPTVEFDRQKPSTFETLMTGAAGVEMTAGRAIAGALQGLSLAPPETTKPAESFEIGGKTISKPGIGDALGTLSGDASRLKEMAEKGPSIGVNDGPNAGELSAKVGGGVAGEMKEKVFGQQAASEGGGLTDMSTIDGLMGQSLGGSGGGLAISSAWGAGFGFRGNTDGSGLQLGGSFSVGGYSGSVGIKGGKLGVGASDASSGNPGLHTMTDVGKLVGGGDKGASPAPAAGGQKTGDGFSNVAGVQQYNVTAESTGVPAQGGRWQDGYQLRPIAPPSTGDGSDGDGTSDNKDAGRDGDPEAVGANNIAMHMAQVRAEIGPKTPDDKQYFQGSGEKPGVTGAPDAVLHPAAGGAERPKELQTADGQCGNNVTIQPHGPGAATPYDPAAEGIGVATLPK